MRSELAQNTAEILTAVSQSWTFDTRDIERPQVHELVQSQIAKSKEDRRIRLEAEFFGAGPLTSILEDVSIREIIINGTNEVWFEREARLHLHPDHFLSETTFKGFLDRMSSEAGIKVDLAHPFADGHWRGWRVHLACAPLVDCNFHLSLRRLSTSEWDFSMLRERQWADDRGLHAIQTLISERKNLLIVGPTGCGKTTVLSAALRTLPASERVIVLEDTDELPRPNSASTKLLTRIEAPTLREFNLTDLVKQSLRMRPDRLVVGEVRGGEAKDLLLALATGHAGSFGTLHASDARQALLRLEMLVQLGAPQWNVQTIRQLILLTVDTIVVCGQVRGERRLIGIYKLAALETCGFLLEPQYEISR